MAQNDYNLMDTEYTESNENVDNNINVLCESIVHLNLKCGTNDPSRPSDKAIVNDKSGDNALMNCYLTALVGNSRTYNKLGVKRLAQDFNISVTNSKDLLEISNLYTSLGEEEGILSIYFDFTLNELV